jgi:hypothetical protein
VVLTFVDCFMALLITATLAPPAERRIQILPLNQYSYWPMTFGMKYLRFTDHRKCLKCCPSASRHSSHRRRRSDIPFAAVLQEDFQFPYVYFLLVLRCFGSYCCNICPSKNPVRKVTKIKITAGDNSFPEDIGHAYMNIDVREVWAVAESC